MHKVSVRVFFSYSQYSFFARVRQIGLINTSKIDKIYLIMQTTICAPVTGDGKCAVSVIRLSGPQALALARKITASGVDFPPRKQVFCALMDGQSVLDKALVTYFQAPNSFTGEDVVEFSVHGSPYIRGRLLEILCRLGAVPARRGEFSYRAFLNNKMDFRQQLKIII